MYGNTICKMYVLELLKFEHKKHLFDQLNAWEIPSFPVKSEILIDNGCPRGKPIGIAMNRLKDIWMQNHFKFGTEELLKYLPDVIKEIGSTDNSKKQKLN